MKTFKEERERLKEDFRMNMRILKRKEYLLSKLHRMSLDWKDLGGDSWGIDNFWWINFMGNNLVGVNELAELLAYHIYSDQRIKVISRTGFDEASSRIEIILEDTENGVRQEIDLLKDSLTSCEILTSTKEEIKEQEIKRYLCKGEKEWEKF